jgi:6-pyruvoyltetrahydropterin/6-carboxytetrahydropterin synthase
MYYVRKTMEIDAAHNLNLSYDSPCNNLHGHRWRIVVFCKSASLNENDMVIDFKKLKTMIHDKLDHKYINDILPFENPTAENMAKWIVDSIPECYRCEVEESSNNWAAYDEED